MIVARFLAAAAHAFVPPASAGASAATEPRAPEPETTSETEGDLARAIGASLADAEAHRRRARGSRLGNTWITVECSEEFAPDETAEDEAAADPAPPVCVDCVHHERIEDAEPKHWCRAVGFPHSLVTGVEASGQRYFVDCGHARIGVVCGPEGRRFVSRSEAGESAGTRVEEVGA